MSLEGTAFQALASTPRASWRTTEIPQTAPGTLPSLLHQLTGREDLVTWLREQNGLIGWGRVMELEAHGEERIESLRTAWRRTVYASWWTDPLVRPGTGPVALGAITFSATSAARSVLVVPEVLLGQDERGAWVTTAVRLEAGQEDPGPSSLVEARHDALEAQALALLARAQRSSGSITVDEPASGSGQRHLSTVEQGSLSDASYLAAVEETRRRLRAGELDKAVLARDVLVRPTEKIPLDTILSRLARAYPSCWTFSVDGTIGATPELLVRLSERRLTSRVLAGTARRHEGSPSERAAEAERLAGWLSASEKNNREHALARASALEALEPLCSVVHAPERFVLTLPNVLHLASDISGVVAGDTGALSLVRALHPTAAVCGTPRAAAAALIEEVEGMDRGRYAGPVGWVDWHGEGEWCINLRSAEVDPAGVWAQAPARVFGGGGIMPDSVPADELAETWSKMRPVLGALEALERP